MEPRFSPATENAIDELLAGTPDRLACLLPVLRLVQAEEGFLSHETLAHVARRLGVPAERVISTATFYTQLRRQPVGRYHLQVCRNVSCYLRGGDEVLRTVEQELGIRVGESTEDGLFTLSTVECLAACGTAPVLQVNEETYEEMTSGKVRVLLRQLREEKP